MNSFKSKEVADILERKFEIERKRSAVPWGVINLGVAIILTSDMKYGSLSRFLWSISPLLWYLEIALLVIVVVNVIFDLGNYAWLLFGAAPWSVSAQLRTLLGIKASDENFRSTVSKSKSIKDDSPFPGDLSNFFVSSTPVRSSTSSARIISSPSLSPMSSSFNNSCMSDTSQMMSTSVSSWTYFDGDVSGQLKRTPLSGRLSPLDPEDVVLNESSLTKYLNGMGDVEARMLGSGGNDLSNVSSTRSCPWSTNATFGSDVSPLSGNKFQYQLSTRGPLSNAQRAKERESSTSHEEEVWSRLGVSTEAVFAWTENLRKWLSKTVLSRLVAEIDKINESLHWQGVTDVKIGEVSLGILQLRAKGPQFSNLYAVLQYLEVTSNQEYLVQRLRGLQKGGCMSEFRWNGGGVFKGKPWADHLPTDSTIVIHLLCVYLDSRLPLHSGFADGKPFTNKYFCKTPDQPDATRKQSLCIYQSIISPPRFKLASGEEVWKLPKGRNNLFHTILLFLHLLRTREDGMLNRINMGPSGLNMMWIIE